MGLLDNLGNLSPEQTQGLLSFASSMLQAGGPSLKPTSFGQALGGGMTAFNTTMNAERQRKLEEDQLRQIAEMRGLQIQGMAGDLQDKALGRQQQLDAQKWRREYNVQRSTPTGIAQSVLGSNLSPTVGNAAALSAYRQAMPDGIGDAMGGNTMAQFNSRLAEAQAMRASGNPYLIQNADALEKTALEFRPKVKSWEKVKVDGRVQLKPYFEDGTAGAPVSADVAEKLHFQDTGGGYAGLDAYTGAPVVTGKKTMTTGDIVNMRGQDLLNERSAEANNIAAKNGTISLSTGLRKEFDDLPEVKNYKQALPAYSSIIDAASRSTPQADINLVYAIAKLYDPNSVVREGEYATVANSPSVPERVKGWVQFVNGGGRLTESVKNQIMQEAAGRMKSFETPYLSARKNYENIAEQSGGIPSMLFPSQYQSPIVEASKKDPKSAQPNLPRSKIVKLDGGGSATGILGSDGNYYVKRGGKTYRVEDN